MCTADPVEDSLTANQPPTVNPPSDLPMDLSKNFPKNLPDKVTAVEVANEVSAEPEKTKPLSPESMNQKPPVKESEKPFSRHFPNPYVRMCVQYACSTYCRAKGYLMGVCVTQKCKCYRKPDSDAEIIAKS